MLFMLPWSGLPFFLTASQKERPEELRCPRFPVCEILVKKN